MAQNFEVFRMEKLKNEGAVIRNLRHDLDLSHDVVDENGNRQTVFYRKTRDAEKAKDNGYMFDDWKDKEGRVHTRSPEERFRLAMKKWREKVPKEHRKNAVLAAQVIFTFSHEKLQDKNFDCHGYFYEAQKFVYKHFGAENIFNWSFHQDEKTPHITFYFVPLVDGKLNARKIFGNKKTLSKLQDDFHEEVGKKYGLDRGIKKTNLIHDVLNTFYGRLKNLDDDLDRLQLEKKNMTESWDDYFYRTKKTLKEFVEPMMRPLTNLRREVVKLEKEKDNFEKEKIEQAENLKKQIEIEREEMNARLTRQITERLEKEFEKEKETYKEFKDFLKMEPYHYEKNGKILDFSACNKKQLADELASFYLNDTPTVHKRKLEIEREFERNKVIIHSS